MSALTGRVAVVTGAEQSLGRGLALSLADADASVALVGDAATLAPLTADLEARGSRAVAVDADLERREELEDAFATAADEVGGPVDVLVHAAMDPAAYQRRPFETVDDDRWHRVWEGTMRAALAVLQAAYGQMRGRGGRIVFVTPTVSMSGAAGLVPYAAALEGQRLLAKAAARQWGPDGITVNCVAPAPEQVPIDVESLEVSLAAPALGGPGDVETDVGPVVAFLASDAAHFVTGATVGADGGVWMAP
jgi:NAD(P)-dependent dehydrogenase (short-subunit alcohol dehydrogenase family)